VYKQFRMSVRIVSQLFSTSIVRGSSSAPESKKHLSQKCTLWEKAVFVKNRLFWCFCKHFKSKSTTEVCVCTLHLYPNARLIIVEGSGDLWDRWFVLAQNLGCQLTSSYSTRVRWCVPKFAFAELSFANAQTTYVGDLWFVLCRVRPTACCISVFRMHNPPISRSVRFAFAFSSRSS